MVTMNKMAGRMINVFLLAGAATICAGCKAKKLPAPVPVAGVPIASASSGKTNCLPIARNKLADFLYNTQNTPRPQAEAYQSLTPLQKLVLETILFERLAGEADLCKITDISNQDRLYLMNETKMVLFEVKASALADYCALGEQNPLALKRDQNIRIGLSPTMDGRLLVRVLKHYFKGFKAVVARQADYGKIVDPAYLPLELDQKVSFAPHFRLQNPQNINLRPGSGYYLHIVGETNDGKSMKLGSSEHSFRVADSAKVAVDNHHCRIVYDAIFPEDRSK